MPANANVHTSRTPHIWKTIWSGSLPWRRYTWTIFARRLGNISELLNNLNWELLFKRNWIFQLHFQTLYFCTLTSLLAKKRDFYLSVISGPLISPTEKKKKMLRMEKVSRHPMGLLPTRVQSLVFWALVLSPSTRQKTCNKSNKQAGFMLETLLYNLPVKRFLFRGQKKTGRTQITPWRLVKWLHAFVLKSQNGL